MKSRPPAFETALDTRSAMSELVRSVAWALDERTTATLYFGPALPPEPDPPDELAPPEPVAPPEPGCPPLWLAPPLPAPARGAEFPHAPKTAASPQNRRIRRLFSGAPFDAAHTGADPNRSRKAQTRAGRAAPKPHRIRPPSRRPGATTDAARGERCAFPDRFPDQPA